MSLFEKLGALQLKVPLPAKNTEESVIPGMPVTVHALVHDPEIVAAPELVQVYVGEP